MLWQSCQWFYLAVFYLVSAGAAPVSCEGGLGENDKVTHALQPDGRLSAANSEYALKFK
jgi:hypothetical protein